MKMLKGHIHGINIQASRLVLGTMIVSRENRDRSFDLLDAAYEAGINTFDTAAVYAGGDSERGLGMWCEERGLREKIVILDKGCHPNEDRARVTPFDLEFDIANALARLRTAYIDIFMLHRDDTSKPVGAIVDAFNNHITEGRILAYGMSNWTAARIREAADYAAAHNLVPPAASSPNYGLADQVENPWGPGCVSLSGSGQKADRDWHSQTQMPVFAYSSLGRGLFSGRISRENYLTAADHACQRAYCHEINFKRLDRAISMAAEKKVTAAQLALAFVLNSPMLTFAIVGAESRQEIEQCTAACSIKLSSAELAWLEHGDNQG